MGVGVVLGGVLGVWTGVYLNGNGSGKRMTCTDDFDLVGVFVSDFDEGG